MDLLRSRGEALKRLGSEWEWKFHDERVTIRGNVWYDQYTQRGGDAKIAIPAPSARSFSTTLPEF